MMLFVQVESRGRETQTCAIGNYDFIGRVIGSSPSSDIRPPISHCS